MTFIFSFFLMWIIFKVFIEFVAVSFFFFGIKASGILVLWPEMEPATPTLEGEVLTTGPPRKSQWLHFRVGRNLTKVTPANRKEIEFGVQQNWIWILASLLTSQVTQSYSHDSFEAQFTYSVAVV